jgi:putative endonuclease
MASIKNKNSDYKILGNSGEMFVVKYLQQQGFTIFAQNYRKFFGEIDIIAYKKNLYIFVEVKTRKSKTPMMGQLISISKQKKIIKTAENFIVEEKIAENNTYRFDVALLVLNDTNFSIDYIQNAFTKKEEFYAY